MSLRIQRNPSCFGKIAVVCGGKSTEREVSLHSGRLVHEDLLSSGVDATLVDGIPSLVDGVRAGHFARVFNALHGGEGESGVLQGFLAACGVPCTGPDLLGCAVSFDKLQTKKNWLADGIRTPAFFKPSSTRERWELPKGFNYPLIVKPVKEGSSFGVSLVHTDEGVSEFPCSRRG